MTKINDRRAEFASRLHEVCAEKGLAERGRQTALGRLCAVSYQAAKKWLDGDGWPALDKALTICEWGGVNVNWLLQGQGPKRGTNIDANRLGVLEAVDALPADDRQQALDFIRYKVEKADGWFAHDQLGRYLVMLDKISRAPKG